MTEPKFTTKEMKEEIIARIKNEGKSAGEIARQYGISPKTVYNWLRAKALKDTSVLEIGRLKRENEELLKIIGRLTRDLSKGKKI